MHIKTRIAVLIIALFLVIYPGSYWHFRNSHVQIWDHDKKPYVIFPAKHPLIYRIYRPLTYVDGFITGMHFHLGPHRKMTAS